MSAEEALPTNALRIYPTKTSVTEHNHQQLRDLLQLAYLAEVTSHGPEASETAFDGAGNLHNSLPLVINRRVMLTLSLWIEKGQANCARETVKDVVQKAGADGRKGPLSMLVIAFYRYNGTSMQDNSCVPVLRT